MNKKTQHSLNDQVIDSTIPQILILENGGRPQWLLCKYKRTQWVLRDIGDKPNRTVELDVSLPNGKRLPDYPALLETIQRIVYGVRTGPLAFVESAIVQVGIANCFITLVRWMISNDIYSFSELTSRDVAEYCELAVFGTNVILNAEAVLSSHIQQLVVKANFLDTDSIEQRLAKAKAHVPHYTFGESNRCAVMNRFDVMAAAGLDGVPPRGATLFVLDRLEASCGFYLTLRARERLSNGVLLDEIDEQPVTTEHLRRLLRPFDLLYKHRRYLNDCVSHNLFPGGSPGKMASKFGKAVGRTGTVPVKQAATFIERSIRWVLDYAPIILDAKDGKNVTGRYPDNAPASPFPLSLRARVSNTSWLQPIGNGEDMTIVAAINFLMAACGVVIAAFTARRAAEIVGLKVGCIERDETGKPWMHIFIHKTSQGMSVIPVPEVVAQAVSVLERLSESARLAGQSLYIFQYQCPMTGSYRGLSSDGFPIFPISRFLREFGYFVDIPLLESGEKWTFRPHQFRRFFAILYIWIYELGDWGALSFHLRHFNPEMTRRYISDPELGNIIAIANKEYTAQILANAATGKVSISGATGTRFKEIAKRLYDRMAQQIQVVPERKFIQRIMRFVERSNISLKALPWGYCAHAPTIGNDHKCQCSATSTNQPDYDMATFSSCKDCIFNFRTPAFIPYLKNTLAQHEAIAHSSNAPKILRNASVALSRDLHDYIASVIDTEEGVLL